MGITERREREKNERRNAILDAARELILAQGVQKVSMEDIAHKAELSKATVYLYFSGKEDILNEICEESARVFMKHIQSFLESGVTGIAAIKALWNGYVELFGNSDEMIIVFMVRNYLYPGQPFISADKDKSPNVDMVINAIKYVINQCKKEGFFDPNLDADMATHLLLTMFSNFVDSATKITTDEGNASFFIESMKKTFQVMLYGFAREGVDRSTLNILE